MQQAHDRLQHAAQRLEELRRPGYEEVASRLDVRQTGDGLVVFWLLNEDGLFVPEEGESIFGEIMRLLGSSQVAPCLASLTLEGHEIAANGLINWDVEPLAYGRSKFTRLRTFRLGSIAADDGEPCSASSLEGREGERELVATRLLGRMPALEELVLPEPPADESFFRGRPHPLRRLTVFDVDFSSFVPRLTASRRFAHLEEVRFVESFRTDVCPRLPAAEYARLFRSPGLPALRAVTLGQVDVTGEQVPRLRGTGIGRQLCRLTVGPAKPWCDRPIVRSPEPGASELRGLFGEPFVPPAAAGAWLTPTAKALAQEMRGSGDLSPMPILGDALEDAGCDDAAVLGHCRQRGHVKGCWVLDLVLGEGSHPA
jgi:hypothetical protein